MKKKREVTDRMNGQTKRFEDFHMKKKTMLNTLNSDKKDGESTRFEDLHMDMLLMASSKVGEGHSPLAVAAIFTQIGYSLYKTALNQEDYELIAKYIYDSRTEIKHIVPPVNTLQ